MFIRFILKGSESEFSEFDNFQNKPFYLLCLFGSFSNLILEILIGKL